MVSICFILLQCTTGKPERQYQAPGPLCRDFDFTDECPRCIWRDPKTLIQLSCSCCGCWRCIYILSAWNPARYRWFPLRPELGGFSDAALIPPPSPIRQCLTITSAQCSKSQITAMLSLTGLFILFILNRSSGILCYRAFQRALNVEYLNITLIKYDKCKACINGTVTQDWATLMKPYKAPSATNTAQSAHISNVWTFIPNAVCRHVTRDYVLRSCDNLSSCPCARGPIIGLAPQGKRLRIELRIGGNGSVLIFGE